MDKARFRESLKAYEEQVLSKYKSTTKHGTLCALQYKNVLVLAPAYNHYENSWTTLQLYVDAYVLRNKESEMAKFRALGLVW